MACFEVFFNDWIIFSLFQISFQERFVPYRNQEANWQFTHFTGFYLVLHFTKNNNNPLHSIKFVIFVKLNLVSILFQ